MDVLYLLSLPPSLSPSHSLSLSHSLSILLVHILLYSSARQASRSVRPLANGNKVPEPQVPRMRRTSCRLHRHPLLGKAVEFGSCVIVQTLKARPRPWPGSLKAPRPSSTRRHVGILYTEDVECTFTTLRAPSGFCFVFTT